MTVLYIIGAIYAIICVTAMAMKAMMPNEEWRVALGYEDAIIED